jgi:hypothetical protein
MMKGGMGMRKSGNRKAAARYPDRRGPLRSGGFAESYHRTRGATEGEDESEVDMGRGLFGEEVDAPSASRRERRERAADSKPRARRERDYEGDEDEDDDDEMEAKEAKIMARVLAESLAVVPSTSLAANINTTTNELEESKILERVLAESLSTTTPSTAATAARTTTSSTTVASTTTIGPLDTSNAALTASVATMVSSTSTTPLVAAQPPPPPPATTTPSIVSMPAMQRPPSTTTTSIPLLRVTTAAPQPTPTEATQTSLWSRQHTQMDSGHRYIPGVDHTVTVPPTDMTVYVAAVNTLQQQAQAAAQQQQTSTNTQQREEWHAMGRQMDLRSHYQAGVDHSVTQLPVESAPIVAASFSPLGFGQKSSGIEDHPPPSARRKAALHDDIPSTMTNRSSSYDRASPSPIQVLPNTSLSDHGPPRKAAQLMRHGNRKAAIHSDDFEMPPQKSAAPSDYSSSYGNSRGGMKASVEHRPLAVVDDRKRSKQKSGGFFNKAMNWLTGKNKSSTTAATANEVHYHADMNIMHRDAQVNDASFNGNNMLSEQKGVHHVDGIAYSRNIDSIMSSTRQKSSQKSKQHLERKTPVAALRKKSVLASGPLHVMGANDDEEAAKEEEEEVKEGRSVESKSSGPPMPPSLTVMPSRSADSDDEIDDDKMMMSLYSKIDDCGSRVMLRICHLCELRRARVICPICRLQLCRAPRSASASSKEEKSIVGSSKIMYCDDIVHSHASRSTHPRRPLDLRSSTPSVRVAKDEPRIEAGNNRYYSMSSMGTWSLDAVVSPIFLVSRDVANSQLHQAETILSGGAAVDACRRAIMEFDKVSSARPNDYCTIAYSGQALHVKASLVRNFRSQAQQLHDEAERKWELAIQISMAQRAKYTLRHRQAHAMINGGHYLSLERSASIDSSLSGGVGGGQAISAELLASALPPNPAYRLWGASLLSRAIQLEQSSLLVGTPQPSATDILAHRTSIALVEQLVDRAIGKLGAAREENENDHEATLLQARALQFRATVALQAISYGYAHVLTGILCSVYFTLGCC